MHGFKSHTPVPADARLSGARKPLPVNREKLERAAEEKRQSRSGS